MVGPVTQVESTAGSSQTWSWAMPFELRSAHVVRVRVAALLAGSGLRRDTVDDACAVMSELVANAVRHASPRDNGEVGVTVTLDPDSVVLAVADGGSVTVPSVMSPAPLARGGRGLGIVHSLTRDWGVKESPEGNTVFGILNRV